MVGLLGAVIIGIALVGIAAAALYAKLKGAKKESDDAEKFSDNDVDCTTQPCPVQQKLQEIVDGVNPSNSMINCGNIIDAVIKRLNGTDPDATAPDEQDGTFSEIEGRYGTNIKWGSSFEDAFDAVRNGGDGTIAIVGIIYSKGSSHVVVMTNLQGNVAILEGQDWGDGNPREVINSPERANERYNPDGDSNIGYGIIQTSTDTVMNK